MKNFTYLSRTVLAGLLVALLTVTAQAQTHFGSVNGNSLNDTWTLYLTDLTMDGTSITSGDATDDEIAVYDGTTLVAVFLFDGSEDFSLDGDTDNPFIAFSELNSGTGYTAGNEVTFKYWDSSAGMEYTGVFGEDDVYDDDAHETGDYFEGDWNTNGTDDDGDGNDDVQFPTGSNPYSYISLAFSTGGTLNGVVTLSGDCNGDVENVNIEVEANGNIVGATNPESDGSYEINGIPYGNFPYTVTASLADYDNDSQEFGFPTTDPVNEDLDLTAHIGDISGTITDAVTGSAINDGGITVELYNANDALIDTYVDSNNNGNYAFYDVCVGEYYLVISHDDYNSETGNAFNLANGDDLDKDYDLEPLNGSISGTVKEDDGNAGTFTGDALAGAWVKATNYNVDPAEELFYTTTDNNGNFSAPDVPAGTWYVVSGGTIGGIQYNADSVTVTVSANSASSGVKIELNSNPGSIEGVVRSSTNSSLISGVVVYAYEHQTTAPLLGNGVTDGSGAYSIPDLDAGIYDVHFIENGYETRIMEYVVVNPDQVTALNAWMVEEPGHIKVHTDPAVAGATVKIGDTYTATYESDGKYKFTDIPVGTYDITVTHSNYHTTIIGNVQVTSNNTTHKTAYLEGYHWDALTGNTTMPIWTIYLQTVTLDGEGVEAGDEIAIYDGSNMVGVYHVESGLSSGNATNQDMTAYSDITGGAGYTAGSSYTFKLYDQSTGNEFTSPAVTLSDPNNSGAYDGNVFPSGMSPFSFVTLAFQSNETQTFAMSEGYQLISSRILTSGDLETVVSDIKDNLDFVKHENAQKLDTVGGSWVNNIGNWENTEGYLVKMWGDDSFEMEGTPIDPQTEIPLNNGFSIVSYLPETSMDVATAFAGVKDNLVFVRNTAGKHYWKIGGTWVNNIGNLNPGEGYFIKTSAKDTLIYPTAKGSAGVFEDDVPQHFTFEGGDATEPVYTIYIKSDKLQAGDEIAAYDGDVMVGATVIEDPANENVNDLNLFSIVDNGQGYEAGNKVTFKVWSPRTYVEYTNIDVEYTNPHGDAYMEDTFPSGEEQYSIIKASVTELAVPEFEEAVVNVYPNPATNNMFIQTENEMTQIRVLNATGQVIMTKQVNAKEFTLNVNGMDAGIYILQTTFENRQSSLRFAVQ